MNEMESDHKSLEVDESFFTVFRKFWIMFSLQEITCSFLFASVSGMQFRMKQAMAGFQYIL